MAISEGDTLPDGIFRRLTEDGLEERSVRDIVAGRKVLLIGMPGAYTNTCSGLHMPSLVRQADAIRAKGVDEIVVFVVNDVQVTQSWAKSSGAEGAGITVVADVDGSFTKSIGMNYDAPQVGFFNRSVRHAMVVEDGKVGTLEVEEGRGVCDMTGGEAILELL